MINHFVIAFHSNSLNREISFRLPNWFLSLIDKIHLINPHHYYPSDHQLDFSNHDRVQARTLAVIHLFNDPIALLFFNAAVIMSSYHHECHSYCSKLFCQKNKILKFHADPYLILNTRWICTWTKVGLLEVSSSALVTSFASPKINLSKVWSFQGCPSRWIFFFIPQHYLPYSSLSLGMRYPGKSHLYQQWNSKRERFTTESLFSLLGALVQIGVCALVFSLFLPSRNTLTLKT